MPRTEESQVLEYTVQQVLETMCFSEALHVSEPLRGGDIVGTTVAFTGSLRGYLRLEIASAAASTLAESFLGLHDSTSDALETEGTVQELGNVICGRFLSLLHPSASLSIDSPVQKLAAPCSDLAWQNFRADCGPLRVAVVFDSMNATNGR